MTVPRPTKSNPPPALKDTWGVYQTLFKDHLEGTNHAPRTLTTYGIAVEQLGHFLRAEGYPTDPTKVKREHLSAWMLHLQRPAEAGGRGLSAQTVLQRRQSVRQFFKVLQESGDITESPMTKLIVETVAACVRQVAGSGSLRVLFGLEVPLGTKVCEDGRPHIRRVGLAVTDHQHEHLVQHGTINVRAIWAFLQLLQDLG